MRYVYTEALMRTDPGEIKMRLRDRATEVDAFGEGGRGKRG